MAGYKNFTSVLKPNWSIFQHYDYFLAEEDKILNIEHFNTSRVYSFFSYPVVFDCE